MNQSNYVWFDIDTMIIEPDLPEFLGITAQQTRDLIKNGVFKRIGSGSTLPWHGPVDVFDKHRVRSDLNYLRGGGMVVFLDGVPDDHRG